eukprot:TRINITY_DN9675_c0_g3_i1.p1 TRINITY_DN9675_c0_g3~~TRINITY_DN9675_c0_g3_i1.p1  ORF type:complete len:624 (+),score=278.94 TRINITY_DN9675_c0_g3_i1:54-1874(+)
MGKRKNSAKVAKPDPESEEEKESGSESESVEPPKKAAKVSKKPAPKGKKGKKRDPSPSSEESESESSEPKPKTKAAKKPAGKKAAPKKGKQPEPDTESESESESEEKPKKKPAGKKAAAKKSKKPEPESESDESESESEPPKKKAAKKPAGKKAAPKKSKQPEPESEPESESADSEAESEPEAPEAKPAKSGGGKGGRTVDREVPNKDAYSVVEDWAVLLNQTNIGNNNNKFYIIQLLQNNIGKYSLWTRWGRVGESGQNALKVLANRGAAETAFKAKFKHKTKNNYPLVGEFVTHPGKYTIVETDESGEGGGDEPLGKLSEGQINKGLEVLAELNAIVEGNKKSSEIERLSSKYYTLIPTTVGRCKPELINTPDKVAEKKATLEFFLRMGFSGVEEEKDINPIEGVLEEPLRKTLAEACKGLNAKVESLEKKGHYYAGKQVGEPVKKMEGKLYAALLLYTSNSIYGEMNKALRDQLKTQCRKYLPYLRMLFEATDHLQKHTRTLWRGIGVDLHKQYKEGSTVTWWSVSSCTSAQSVAEGFMGGCGSSATMLTIKCKRAIDISCITMYPHEKENILVPGTQLRVVTNKKVKGVTHIELEEVGWALA